MTLYRSTGMQNLPIQLTPMTGWACAIEIDGEVIEEGSAYLQYPMSESDVRELIEMLEETL